MNILPTQLLPTPITTWLQTKQLSLFGFQIACWQHLLSGKSGLWNEPKRLGVGSKEVFGKSAALQDLFSKGLRDKILE